MKVSGHQGFFQLLHLSSPSLCPFFSSRVFTLAGGGNLDQTLDVKESQLLTPPPPPKAELNRNHLVFPLCHQGRGRF